VVHVYLVPAFLLAAGTMLLASRDKAVKTAGAVLVTACPLLLLWMGEVTQKIGTVTDDVKGVLTLFHALVCGYVAACWIWFFVSLRRLQKKEDRLLSSVGRQRGPANEPREVDWRQQPPPGAV